MQMSSSRDRIIGAAAESEPLKLYYVRFEPRARTFWHAHQGTQILVATAGRCRLAHECAFNVTVGSLADLYRLQLTTFIDRNLDSPLDLAWPLKPALDLVRLSLGLGLLVIGQVAPLFLDLATGLLEGAFDAIAVHETVPPVLTPRLRVLAGSKADRVPAEPAGRGPSAYGCAVGCP